MDAGSSTILFVLVVSVTAVQSQITKGPEDAVRKVGDSVMLECVTRSNNCDHIEWKKIEGAQSPLTVYKDGIGIINTDAFPHERYSVNSTGGCNLTITQLKISDSGKFSCVLSTFDFEDRRFSFLVVNNPVENIAVSPSSGPYYKGATVRCTADGYPYPTFKWTHLMSGDVIDNDTLVIEGEPGDKYNCTAMNTIEGRVESQSVTIEVSSCYVGAIIGCLVLLAVVCAAVTLVQGPALEAISLVEKILMTSETIGAWMSSNRLRLNPDGNGDREKQAEVPLTSHTTTSEPAKPPKGSDPQYV